MFVHARRHNNFKARIAPLRSHFGCLTMPKRRGAIVGRILRCLSVHMKNGEILKAIECVGLSHSKVFAGLTIADEAGLLGISGHQETKGKLRRRMCAYPSLALGNWLPRGIWIECVLNESSALSVHYLAVSRGERAQHPHSSNMRARVHTSIWFQLPNRVAVAPSSLFTGPPSPDGPNDA